MKRNKERKRIPNRRSKKRKFGSKDKYENEEEIKKPEEDESVKKQLGDISNATGLKIIKKKGFLSKIRNQLNLESRKIREDKEAYKREIKEKLEKEKQEAIRKTVAEQSAALKKRFRDEFNEKLRLELRAKEADFEKKKADLALDIEQKAKALFH